MHASPVPERFARALLFALGCVVIYYGARMTYEFGLSMSTEHAVILGALTIVTALMWGPVDSLRQSGHHSLARGFAIVGVAFIAVELFSHLGYTVGHRVRDTEETGIQNTRHKMAGDTVTDSRATLAFLEKELQALIDQEPWTATVSATGLRADVSALQEAIRQEAARVRCGERCLKLKRDLADVERRRGLVEKREDLTKQIASLRTAVATQRDKAATTEFRTSKIVAQTKFVSQILTQELEPGQGAMTWTQIGIAFAVALVTTFLAPVCFFLALSGRVWASAPMTGSRHGLAAVPAVEASDEVQSALASSLASTLPRDAKSSVTLLRQTLTDARAAQAAAAAFGGFLPKKAAAT